MSETDLTAAEADALSGTTDADCDAVYLTIGDSTYYTEFYRLLQRLLTMAKVPGNELRVCKDGDLTIEVRPGKIQIGGITHDYSGITGEAVTNNQTNYIYLTAADLAAGNTVSQSTSAFPTDGTFFIPLATVLTAGGDYAYTDITDYRGRALWAPPGSVGRVVEENAAGVASPNVLIAEETGKVLSNEGSTATNYHTLPTAVAGLTYTFVRADASDDLRITAAASDKIVVGGTATKAAGYVESTARWDAVTLVALDEEYWLALEVQGTWTVETS